MTSEKKTGIKLELNNIFSNPLYILWILIPFTFFSLVTTKVDWYMIPLFPPLSILCGWYLTDHINAKKTFLTGKKILVLLVFFVMLFEAVSVIVINSQDKESYQKIFKILKSYPPSSVYFVDRGRNQAEIFLAKVVYRYNVKKTDDINTAISQSETGDFIFTADEKNNYSNMENNFKILSRADGYLLGIKE